MKFIFAFFFVSCATLNLISARQLPSFIKKCKRHDPQLNECMREAFTNIKPHIRKGIKELRVPNLDPYIVTSTTLSTSWVNCTLTNLTVNGLDDYNVESIKFDLGNDPEIIVASRYGPSTFNGHYVLDGKILQFALHGEGKVEMQIENALVTLTFNGKIVRENGKEYLRLDKPTVDMKDHVLKRIYFHNLFANNPELTERINEIFQTDSETYGEEIVPVIGKVIAEVVLQVFRGTFDRFSLDELFD